jgi:hypothetical protein
MPIQLEIFHPDRIVVVVARGSITLQEYGELIAEIIRADVTRYRKIIDATSADSAAIDHNVLLAFDEQIRNASQGRPRGPLALVVDRARGDLARTFKAMASPDRPVEVFGSIHDARKWLQSLPIVE